MNHGNRCQHQGESSAVFNWNRQAGDRAYYVPGDLVRGRTTFSANLSNSGTPADGPWYAYLSRGWMAPRVPRAGTWLAEVGIENLGHGTGLARLEFTLPDVAPGTYFVQVCNDPCTKQLGDIVGGWFRVVEDPTEKRLQRRLDALAGRLAMSRQQLEGRLERRAEANRTELHYAVGTLQQRVEGLETDLDGLREREPGTRPQPWIIAVGALLALGAVAFARRGRRTRPHHGALTSVPPEWTAEMVTSKESRSD